MVSIAPASYHASVFMKPLGCLSLVWLVNLKRYRGIVAVWHFCGVTSWFCVMRQLLRPVFFCALRESYPDTRDIDQSR